MLFRGNELLFRGNEILFRGDEILFRGNEIIFRGNELLFRGNDILFRGNEILFHGNELLFRSNELLFRSNELLFRSNKLLFRGNEILFRWNEIAILTTLFSSYVPLGLPYCPPRRSDTDPLTRPARSSDEITESGLGVCRPMGFLVAVTRDSHLYCKPIWTSQWKKKYVSIVVSYDSAFLT